MNIFSLTEKNVEKYLLSIGISKNLKGVCEIKKHTNVNFVFKVIFSDNQKIFIKQAFDFVKIATDFPAPINRQYFEFVAINYLKEFFNERIPEIIFYDKTNNVLILSDVSQKANLLASEFEEGRFHFEVVNDLANIISILHSKTYGYRNYPVRYKKENKKLINEIIRKFRMKGAFQLFPKEINKLFNESKKSKRSIIYADFAPKKYFCN